MIPRASHIICIDKASAKVSRRLKPESLRHFYIKAKLRQVGVVLPILSAVCLLLGSRGWAPDSGFKPATFRVQAGLYSTAPPRPKRVYFCRFSQISFQVALQIRTFTICYQIRLRFDLKFCTIFAAKSGWISSPSASQFVADLSIGHRQLAQSVVGRLMLNKSDSNSSVIYTNFRKICCFCTFLLQNLLTGHLLHTKLHQHSTHSSISNIV